MRKRDQEREARKERNIGAKDAREKKVRKDERARANLVLSVLRCSDPPVLLFPRVGRRQKYECESHGRMRSPTRKMVDKVEGRKREG